jgi:hypothetical protein
MRAGGRVAETQQVHPAHRARLGPGLGGDPGPQRRRSRVQTLRCRRWRHWHTGASDLGLDHELDGVPEPAGLDLDLQGEPAGEPVGIQQQQQPRGDLGQPQLIPRPCRR